MGCHRPCCEVNEDEEAMQKLITDNAKYVALLNVEPPATLFMNLPMSMMVQKLLSLLLKIAASSFLIDIDTVVNKSMCHKKQIITTTILLVVLKHK